ncbi:MAG: class I SAM-dependent methyltransferase [Cyanophyceae cyanobacterium]
MTENTVLQTRRCWQDAVEQASRLGLPLHQDLPKNWDSLIALNAILQRTTASARVLDAGAETYSVILPWLALHDYRQLIGINLAFAEPVYKEPILYEYGDLTQTKYESNSFDAIACLSVIEHGVDIHHYFREMSRLLKPGGVLVTSTDYYDEPIDTENKIAFGVPLRIFSRSDMQDILSTAAQFDFELTSPLELNCQEKAITWQALSYTFVVFTVQKKI